MPVPAYDPSYFGRSAQELERAGIETVEFMPAPMRQAWQAFYQAAKEGTLTHDGDPVLAAHVEAAAAERSEQGLKVRKLKSSDKIDALVAAVLAHARCQFAKQEERLRSGGSTQTSLANGSPSPRELLLLST